MKTITLMNMAVLLMSAMPGCSKEPQDQAAQKSSRTTLEAANKPFVIPFDQLEPTWSNWKKYGISGKLGLYWKKSDRGAVYGVMPEGLDAISFDSRGQPVPPTKDGSVIFFETDGLQYEWLNKLVIQTDGRVSFNVVEGKGLVHASGKGLCTLPDGKTVSLQ